MLAEQRQVDVEAAALFARGTAQLRAGNRVEAAECLLACLRAAPGFAAAYVNLAAALRELALLAPAQEMAEQALRLLPDAPEARLGLANVLHDRAEYPAAAALYRAVLAANPDHAGACSSLGNSLHVMGQFAEAVAMHDRAVALAPQDVALRINRAACLLAAGNFARGWEDNEWRIKPAPPPVDAWRGEALEGRTILLQAEQGLGDTLQFARFAQLVEARGGRVVLQVPPSLVRLLQRLPGVSQVLATGDALPPIDTHCPMLSLPRIFATRLDSIPAGPAYLTADPAAVLTWQARLPPASGQTRVGLVWAGAPHADDPGAYLMNRRRSLAPADSAPLAGLPGVQWVSLQMPGQPAAAARPEGMDLFDPMPAVSDFADTAAIVASLDLVISVDTSVAHLAGGMGRPVWLLSRHDACWRWLHGRSDSPWYPQMRLYRQERPNDWSPVIRRVCADVTILSRQSAQAVSVSDGRR